MAEKHWLVPAERIERAILLIRDQKVMLDKDLAALYHVETKSLTRAVRRNQARFPADFMFQLTAEEFANLRFQFGTSSWGGRRYLPYAFTEQGVAMLSSVLHSERAVRVNVEIMRAFVRLRQLLASHADLARKLEALEKKYSIMAESPALSRKRRTDNSWRNITYSPSPSSPSFGVSRSPEAKTSFRLLGRRGHELANGVEHHLELRTRDTRVRLPAWTRCRGPVTARALESVMSSPFKPRAGKNWSRPFTTRWMII
jgi:hypothetical protein